MVQRSRRPEHGSTPSESPTRAAVTFDAPDVLSTTGANCAGIRPEVRSVQRADWRFLLPEPDLGRVVVVGPASIALDDAVRAVATDADFQLHAPARPVAHYDVAVALRCRPAELPAVAALVRPGGFVYAEARRSCRFGPRAWAAAAAALGLIQPRLYWHWPDFESCTRMVPWDSVEAVQHAARRSRPGLRAWWHMAVITVLGHREWLCGWACCLSLVARLP